MKLQSENETNNNTLTISLLRELESQLVDNARITRNLYSEKNSIGVLAGQSGVALFQFYCAKYFDDDSYSETGVEIVSHIISRINEGYAYPTYCNGLAGFGWVLQHLVDEEFIDLDLDDLFSHFDDYLLNQMIFELKEKHYDMLHGAMGYGMYFLKRYNGKSTNKEKKDFYQNALKSLVNHLEVIAIKDGRGIRWESVLNTKKGNKGFNLSLSHGISSIIYMLYKLSELNIEKDSIIPLVQGAIQYLRCNQRKQEEGFSLFPSWVDPNQTPTFDSRLAWCYGDIGMSKAFEWSGKVLIRSELNNLANIILGLTSRRVAPENTLVVDAGFCHGSFGNAHMFHQFALQNKQEDYEKAAQFWLKDGLARHTGNREEPYKRWDAIDKSWKLECNLLEGLSGIGLAMISLLSNEESTWDECLMLR